MLFNIKVNNLVNALKKYFIYLLILSSFYQIYNSYQFYLKAIKLLHFTNLLQHLNKFLTIKKENYLLLHLQIIKLKFILNACFSLSKKGTCKFINKCKVSDQKRFSKLLYISFALLFFVLGVARNRCKTRSNFNWYNL